MTQKPQNLSPTTTQKTWHVYLLKCKDNSFYTGVTNDLNKRMQTHAEGKGSKYVKRKGFSSLLKSQPCKSKSDAQKAEYQIKQLPRQEKLEWFNQLSHQPTLPSSPQ